MSTRVDLSKFDNSWYEPGGNIIKRVLWYYTNALIFNSYLFPFSKIKVLILRLFGAVVGKGCVVKPMINIKYPWKLKMGDHIWIGEKVWIDNLAEIIIEDNVCLSQGVYLLCGNHNYLTVRFDLIVKPIHIRQGAWIGAKAIVGPGVIVGEGAVLSVASIATKNVEGNYIYRGNPAQKIKSRGIVE